jgi:hypothetical protein
MIIVGGLGSVAGAVYGAAFIMLLPPLLAELADLLRPTVPFLADQLPAVQVAAFGLVIVLFLLFEPRAQPNLATGQGLRAVLALPLLTEALT